MTASLDPQEAAYYERLAGLWWDPAGPFWPLHGLNRFRVGYLRARLLEHFGRGDGERPLTGLRMVDIGCGGGILSESMAALGAEVLGIDPVARNIAVAERHAEGSGLPVRYAVTGAEALAEAGERFDAVLNMEVVEHVTGLPGFMAACCDLVRPGGAMFVATINRTPLAALTAILGAEYVLRWLPRGTHQYRKLRRPAEVAACLRAGGLRVNDRTGVAISPVTRRFRYTRSLAVNYMMMAVRDGAPAGG